jgi:ABC-type nitrate/sulfonate/bicarbonate transport system substrate-binding protein
MTCQRSGLFLAAMFFLPAFRAECAPAQPPSRDLPKVLVVAAPFLAHAPFYLALENGDFEKEGVAVEVVRVSRVADSMIAIVSGQADVMLGNITVGFLNMVAKGEAPRIVADKGYVPAGCGERAIVARKDLAAKLATAQGARGLRAVVTVASPSAYHFDLKLQETGLTLDDVTIVEVPNPEIAGAFATGAIDMAHAAEPWLSQSMRTGKVELWKKSDPRVPGGVVYFAGRLLGKDRDQGRRFLRGYLRGVARFREGKTPRNVEVLMKATGLDRTLVEGACWPEVSASGRIEAGPLKGFAEWARKRGYLARDLDASRAIDLTLLDEIARTPSPAR